MASNHHHPHCTLELLTCHPFMTPIIATTYATTDLGQDQRQIHRDPPANVGHQAIALVRQIFAVLESLNFLPD